MELRNEAIPILAPSSSSRGTFMLEGRVTRVRECSRDGAKGAKIGMASFRNSIPPPDLTM